MSDYTDAFAALLAEIPQGAIPATPGDDDFGADLACTDDLTEDFLELEGTDERIVREAVIRRLTTPRGSLADDLDYGVDLRGYLNRGLSPAGLRELEGVVLGELLRDDRIDDATASATLDGSTLRVEVSGSTARGPFALTLALTDSETLLEEMTRP